MLDSMQNTILNKPDSVMERRSSPSSDVRNLESKFENLFNKKKTESTEAAKSSQGQKDAKAEVSKVAQAKENTTQKSVKNLAQSTGGVEFSDGAGEESKLALQEKIAKSSKDKPIESNPLLEALSASSASSATSATKALNTQQAQKAQNTQAMQPLAKQMPMPQKTPSLAQVEGGEHSPSDVEKLAKAKGLNPSKISLEYEVEHNEVLKAPKQKIIPASAKESISYEYENNTDRIAIVQRGTKKPKNITSKISSEYPTKKSDDAESKGGVSPLKDTPPLS